MTSLNPLDFDLVVVFGVVIVTALVARATQLPITALEILAGILLAFFFSFQLPVGTDAILTLGALLIVFLAGIETNVAFLRAHFRKAMVMGLGGFLVPFVGLLLVLVYVVRAPLLVSVIGATVLADTSISIVYTTLQQYDLTNLPFGRLVLAATLSVNLVEDLAITTTTFLSAPAFVFTLGVLAALAVAAILLPRLARRVSGPGSPVTFSNLPARTLLFSLALLALLSALVGVPGILFVFLMGLIFSQWVDEPFIVDMRKLAFALFVPVYFLAVGLRVDLGFVLANWPLLIVLAGAATVLKIAAIFPLAARFMGRRLAGPVSVLMNARLTSATVILVLTLGLGLLTSRWYSLFVTVVALLALGSSISLRGFDGFRSTQGARALFGGGRTPSEGLPTT
ncbi:MAG: cation:proton antiporter [Thermoplasmata archaeon]|nr:cation:proton antiporter [Thermoplasmata archaeon]